MRNPASRATRDLKKEAQFLAGRRSPWFETVRLLGMGAEMVRGFRAFHNIGPTITVFGSARFAEEHPYYQLAMEIGAALAKDGFTVMTGGGPGIMEAANRGAKSVGGSTVGCNVVLPYEQIPNPYLDKVVTFTHFFIRKLMLVKYSYAFIIMPGGTGTLDEMTEAITLIQTGKLYEFPVILVNREYWKGLTEWFDQTVIRSGAISPQDLKFLRYADSALDVLQIIRQATQGLNLSVQPISATPDG